MNRKPIRGFRPLLFSGLLAMGGSATAQGVPTIDLSSIAKIG